MDLWWKNFKCPENIGNLLSTDPTLKIRAESILSTNRSRSSIMGLVHTTNSHTMTSTRMTKSHQWQRRMQTVTPIHASEPLGCLILPIIWRSKDSQKCWSIWWSQGSIWNSTYLKEDLVHGIETYVHLEVVSKSMLFRHMNGTRYIYLVM